MINDAIVACYNNILNSELIEATGCTEPIALALVGAVGKAALKEMPEKIELYCSSNMIKNCKSVTVPNSGGIKGMQAAVLLGVIGGDCHNMLQVLSHITDKHREQLKEVFMLIDFRHKPSSDDILMYKYLKYYNLKVTIVATKIDKISFGQREKYKNINCECG